MADWIFTGKQNLQGPLVNGKPGSLVRPYEPFDAPVQWRQQFEKMPHIHRRIMTIADYKRWLATLTWAQLLTEMKHRGVNTSPADVRDCRWLLTPLDLYRLLRAALTEIEDPEWVAAGQLGDVAYVPTFLEGSHGARHAARYAGHLDAITVAQADATYASAPIRQAVRAYVLADTGLTEPELMAVWIDKLMEPFLNPNAGDDEAERQDRRARVAELFGEGVSQAEIARQLAVSRNTVRKDLASSGLV